MKKNPDYRHITELIIDFEALRNNIAYYQSKLSPQCSIMPVIKADAYGSGVLPIAKKLQDYGIEHFAVAFIKEAIELRNAGIKGKILVLYPDLVTIEAAWEYDLDLEIYSAHILDRLIQIAQQKSKVVNIHLMIDTGMHRMGFMPEDIFYLSDVLRQKHNLKVEAVMSHLASSEDEQQDSFTNRQIERLEDFYKEISKIIGYRPKKHIQNTAGVLRHEMDFDFARIGIGLYGINPSGRYHQHLEKVHTLLAKIIQIKTIEAGAGISYNQNTILSRRSKVAVVNIGYADGLMRSVGNAKFSVYINGQYAPILGNVTMDAIIIDVTDLEDVHEYDTVEIFGKNNPIETLAAAAQTIPYEILCALSNRISRVYI